MPTIARIVKTYVLNLSNVSSYDAMTVGFELLLFIFEV
jgi:hypothetical protein